MTPFPTIADDEETDACMAVYKEITSLHPGVHFTAAVLAKQLGLREHVVAIDTYLWKLYRAGFLRHDRSKFCKSETWA